MNRKQIYAVANYKKSRHFQKHYLRSVRDNFILWGNSFFTAFWIVYANKLNKPATIMYGRDVMLAAYYLITGKVNCTRLIAFNVKNN